MIRLGLRTGWFLVVMTAAGATATSCGGDGGTCGMVTPCGGNIVGDWRITSSCIKGMDTLGNSSCPTATVTSSATATGTTSYRADMTYTVSFTLTGSDSVVIPASCLSAGTTCDQVNQVFFRGLLPDLRCSSASSGGCNCSLVVPPTPIAETGTYTTSGGTLTTTPTGATPDSGGYCVKGDQLDLTPPAAMAGATGTMSGDLTLMRQ
jgi:hypothetical protein